MSKDIKGNRGVAMKQSKAFNLVKKELVRARTKFPPYNSPHEGYAVIKEELDETWDDIKANRDASKEAAQVAATAIRFIIDLA